MDHLNTILSLTSNATYNKFCLISSQKRKFGNRNDIFVYYSVLAPNPSCKCHRKHYYVILIQSPCCNAVSEPDPNPKVSHGSISRY